TVTDPGDELVEGVDLDGAVTGIVTRRAMRTGRLRHRATFIAVLDDDGRLLIHQRSAAKDLWPSRWDIAAGGVAAVGETWE
ncbi:NUDIX domain-containing protein, partial [Acinetobacter baumannii]|uniref:NUDIX domain-containing protein n=1 Tax=Acinetobacter baumannii TaxID=470 RepID=UPI000E15156B